MLNLIVDQTSTLARLFGLSLEFKVIRILNVQCLRESICFEHKIGDRICNFLSHYGSPRQSQDDFETFTENLELNLENLVQRNAFLVVAI